MTAVNAAVAIAKNASAVLEMIDLFDEFATDAALEINGAWVPYKGATEFLIARANNDDYNKAITKALDENRAALQVGGPEAEALSERLMREVMADTLLKGWKNLKYKGKVVEYSRDVAIELLAHKDFRAFVKIQSENREWFKLKLVADAAKN